MNVQTTNIEGPLILTPHIHYDARGNFTETFHQEKFDAAVGQDVVFVQDNQITSKFGVIRGFHYSTTGRQGKLVRSIFGKHYSVALDLRVSSPTFGEAVGVFLTDTSRDQFWIPPGFAHAVACISEQGVLAYKSTTLFHADTERSLSPLSKDIAVKWPVPPAQIILSSKDKQNTSLKSLLGF